MKFKILKGTDTFQKLKDVQTKMIAAGNASEKLCKELGGTDVYTHNRYAAGGIDAIGFEKEPDTKVWRRAGKSWQNLWYPRSTQKTLLQKFSDLPKVELSEINNIVGFNPGFCGGDGVSVFMVHVKSVGLQFLPKMILIEVENKMKFKPNKDMVEIKDSEFLKLSTTGKP